MERKEKEPNQEVPKEIPLVMNTAESNLNQENIPISADINTKLTRTWSLSSQDSLEMIQLPNLKPKPSEKELSEKIKDLFPHSSTNKDLSSPVQGMNPLDLPIQKEIVFGHGKFVSETLLRKTKSTMDTSLKRSYSTLKRPASNIYLKADNRESITPITAINNILGDVELFLKELEKADLVSAEKNLSPKSKVSLKEGYDNIIDYIDSFDDSSVDDRKEIPVNDENEIRKPEMDLGTHNSVSDKKMELLTVNNSVPDKEMDLPLVVPDSVQVKPTEISLESRLQQRLKETVAAQTLPRKLSISKDFAPNVQKQESGTIKKISVVDDWNESRIQSNTLPMVKEEAQDEIFENEMKPQENQFPVPIKEKSISAIIPVEEGKMEISTESVIVTDIVPVENEYLENEMKPQENEDPVQEKSSQETKMEISTESVIVTDIISPLELPSAVFLEPGSVNKLIDSIEEINLVQPQDTPFLELPTKDANNSTLEAAENQKEKNGTEQPISFIDSHQNCGIDSDSSSAIISRCNSDRISESAIAIKGTSLKDDQNSIQVSEITETSTRRGSKNEHDLEDIFLHLEKLSNVKLEQQRASQPTTNHQKKIRDDLQPIYDSISLLDQSKFDPETIVALLKALGSLQQQANDRISLHSGRTSINSRNSTTIAIDLQNTHVNDIVEKDETTLKKTLFRKFSMANLKKSVSFYKK